MAYIKRALVWVLLLGLAGCGSVSVQDYAGKRPELVPEQFFQGQLVAHGMVKNRTGEVIRRFTADIAASWEDGVGTLDERFVFDDGERQTRIWTLEPQGDSRYRATAGDVIGPGTAEVAGNALFLDYVLRIAYGDGTLDLRIDDRMYLISEDVLLNESVMTKFGVRVGSITLVIQRLP